MLKKPFAFVCCSLAASSVVSSNIALAAKNNTNSKNKNEAKTENSKFKKIGDALINAKDVVLKNKTKSAVIASAALATAETAHAIYEINSVNNTEGLNTVMIGKPCAGKGVISKLLTDRIDAVHFSIGDAIKDEIKRGNITQEEQERMERGELLSNERVFEIVRNFKKRQSKGIIWDGFPRNVEQARELDADLVIYLNVPDEYSNYKVLSRLTCDECGAEFDAVFHRPKNKNKCDYCGHKLGHRADDNTGTMKNRLEDFRKSTLPVIEYYRAQGNLIEVNSDDYPKEVWKKIEKKLKETGKLKGYEENFYSRTWKKFKNLF